MIKVKNVEGRVSSPKKNITITGVTIDDGQFIDENGNIAYDLAAELPSKDMEFTIKITIELEDEDTNEE